MNCVNSDRVIRHVEVKAYLDSFQLLSKRVSALTSTAPNDRMQDDTFYYCGRGRLKLRSSGQQHQLIYYRRENDYGPKESFYQTSNARNPAALRASLGSAFGEVGRVRKFRRSFNVGNACVHLDKVNGLGNFIEIKVQLSQAESLSKGVKTVENLMAVLDVDLFQLVDGAYIDLICEKNGHSVAE
jgi:predicted adenylyl cyclase CyaB